MTGAVLSVGAEHDGTDNDCSSEDQFIMAERPKALDEDIGIGNPYRFSTCSVAAIREYVQYLNM